MSEVLVKDSKLQGEVVIPPSKSVAHRAIICAALAGGESTITPVSESKDMVATISAVELLGATAHRSGDTLSVNGCKASDSTDTVTVDCIESGSTLRFLIPIAAALGGNYSFVGSGRLPTRPIDCYTTLLQEHGVKVDYSGTLPFNFSGKLTPGKFELPGNVSSQYITGLLLALPLLEGDSEIVLTTRLESSGYIDITTKVMAEFGVRVAKTETGWSVKGGQSYSPRTYSVESDWSQGAFFLCAGAIGGDITVKGLSLDSLQGDKAVLDILRNMGADITETENGLVCKKAPLHAYDFDAREVPDIVPVLATTALFCTGTTHITGCERLRIKESDRLVSTNDMLLSFGGCSEIQGDSLVVTGTDTFSEYRKVNGFNDHRIVMSACVAAAFASGETLITDKDSVNKSYPNFYEHYTKLGGNASDF